MKSLENSKKKEKNQILETFTAAKTDNTTPAIAKGIPKIGTQTNAGKINNGIVKPKVLFLSTMLNIRLRSTNGPIP